MPTLKKLWKKLKKNRIAYYGGPLLLFFLVLFTGYFLFKTFTHEEFDRNKTFRIARDPNLYPISLMGKERNLSAFVNELIFKIAEDSHIKVRVVNVSFNLLYDELTARNVDAILTTAAPNPTNRPSFLFSNPLFELGPVLVTTQVSKFATIDDLIGKNVGIRRGDSIQLDESGQGVLFVQYDSYIEALEDLERNRIEAVFMPASAAYTYTHVFYPGKLKVATAPLREEGLRIQSPKSLDNHFFIEIFNKGLKKAIDDGSYDTLLIKWGLINPRKKV